MNMDHCKFQNALKALQQCMEAIQYEDTLSEEEQYSKNLLIALCCRVTSLKAFDTVNTLEN